MKKYELTDECIQHGVRKLYRIKAVKDFGNVRTGELGGFIEKEENLSHKGNAWVYGNAKVSGNAGVYGDAWVYGNAKVSGNAGVYGNARVSGNAEIYNNTHLLQIGGIGSRDAITTFFRTKEKEIYVKCGCFAGNIDEFEEAVEEEHKGTKHFDTYKTAIKLAKLQIELED